MTVRCFKCHLIMVNAEGATYMCQGCGRQFTFKQSAPDRDQEAEEYELERGQEEESLMAEEAKRLGRQQFDPDNSPFTYDDFLEDN